MARLSTGSAPCARSAGSASITSSGTTPTLLSGLPSGRADLEHRHLQARAVGQPEDLRRRDAARRVAAENRGRAVLLNGRGEDLAHRRRAAIDQHDERQVVLAAGAREVDAVLAPAVDLLVHAGARGQEVAQQARANVDASARVTAQVEHQSVNAGFLEFRDVLLDGVDHRRLGEAAQADVADVVLDAASA